MTETPTARVVTVQGFALKRKSYEVLLAPPKRERAKKIKRRMKTTSLFIITASACHKKERSQRLRIWQSTLGFVYSHRYESLRVLFQIPS
jgi:hypothetical protein